MALGTSWSVQNSMDSRSGQYQNENAKQLNAITTRGTRNKTNNNANKNNQTHTTNYIRNDAEATGQNEDIRHRASATP